MAITSWGGGNSSDNLRRSVLHNNNGGVAQMVERSLSMREVPGSIPGASNTDFFSLTLFFGGQAPIAHQEREREREREGGWELVSNGKKRCIVRESNPGRPRGRRAFYH